MRWLAGLLLNFCTMPKSYDGNSMKKKLVIVGVIAILGLYLMSMSASMPNNIGVSDGKLSPLPDSPNAVSTQADDSERRMKPLEIDGANNENMDRLVEIIKNWPRTKIVQQTDNYLHVEFASLIFRFVDDVEFYLDQSAGQIHFRSASRVGHSDMGVNRRRMAAIAEKWDSN